MKKKTFILVALACLFAIAPKLKGQTDFDADAYKRFLDKNKTLTTDDLLSKNLPKTDYYSERQTPSDLKSFAWFDSINEHYRMTDYEKELLSKHHFVVTERVRNNDWAYAFIDIYSNDLPLFISSDFVLHTLHRSYDAILMHLEDSLLEPNLQKLLTAMHNAYDGIYAKYNENDGMADALADVDLYVSVALSLAKNEPYPPQKHGREMYDKLMKAIQAEQMSSLNLFTEERQRKLDFSQFKPRGHYTQQMYENGASHTLENYFKAMMWLGRIDFLMTAPPENPWESNWKKEELQRMQIGAVLLNELLDVCGKRDVLETHEKIIRFLVGPDDNLTPDELSVLSDAMLTSPEKLLDENTYDRFTEALNASDDYGQKIMSNFFYVDPETEDPGKLPVSFRLLGQKFLLDSYITSEVVYDRIKWNNEKPHRGLPDPLDVMAALGNEDALKLMEEEMRKYHYAYKLNALKELIDKYDEDFWTQSSYNNWLSAIRTLNPPESSDKLPYFMQTSAWRHEKLNTQLTSWAELRHDNLLYGKQSYTGGTGCSYPYTYIEPYPELYAAVQTFSAEAIQFFDETLGEGNRISGYYKNYEQIMARFQTISEKELNGTTLNDPEITFLKTMINSYMASGPSISGWYNNLFFKPYDGLLSDFVVADIHTQPTDASGNTVGYVYHVGSGYIDRGVFLAPNPMNSKQLMAFTGPVASFHYDVSHDFFRYNDEEWSDKFWRKEKLPTRPDWISKYLANSDGEAYPKSRELEGSIFISSNITQGEANLIDYLLAFPNPAEDEIHLRFALNASAQVKVHLIDLTGRSLKRINQIPYPAGEHDIPINLKSLQSGNYFVRLVIGDRSFTKKILIR